MELKQSIYLVEYSLDSDYVFLSKTRVLKVTEKLPEAPLVFPSVVA